jgi:CheY-like chemotaxis protein
MAKVLIIDDEQPILNMYSEALSGHEVITALNGQEGIEMAQKNQPDLILLDIIMPKFNGLDVLNHLKDDKDTHHIPVIILTNLPQEASEDKARELGAINYYVKAQFEPDKLASAVDSVLHDNEYEAG